jgi:hypothetical protein
MGANVAKTHRVLVGWSDHFVAQPSCLSIVDRGSHVDVTVKARVPGTKDQYGSTTVLIPRDEFAELWRNLPPLDYEATATLRVATPVVRVGSIVLFRPAGDADDDREDLQPAIVTNVRKAPGRIDLIVFPPRAMPLHASHVYFKGDLPACSDGNDYWEWPQQEWQFSDADDADDTKR